jgi:mRNA-degrading endonuclease RelE of RelBE toxin-antitoxin system
LTILENELPSPLGDYRVFFEFKDDNTIEITAVRHRKEAYR